MSYSLNSLKRGYTRGYIGTTMGGIKGDTRSLRRLWLICGLFQWPFARRVLWGRPADINAAAEAQRHGTPSTEPYMSDCLLNGL